MTATDVAARRTLRLGLPPLAVRLPRVRTPRLALVGIFAVQAVLSLRVNQTAFEDEGLYIYEGHQMIAHLLHGAKVLDDPGSYFSGAPSLYPVLAAAVDSVGGLAAVRLLSLLFSLLAIACVYGTGRRLFGETAGLIGALAFSVCGSVVYVSHLATFDAPVLGLVALAAWLAVRSAQQDGLLWAPVIGGILCLEILVKYAGAVFAPVVLLLAIEVGWKRYRWVVVRRAAFAGVCAVGLAYFTLQQWGGSVIAGVRQTTSSRILISPASATHLLGQIATWVGPWLLLAAIGGLFRVRRQAPLVAVLMVGAVVAPLQQVRIGEAVSLSKHVAFGLIFAAPLIGDLGARVLRNAHWQWARAAAVAATVACLGVLGWRYSEQFLTAWVPDGQLVSILQADAPRYAGREILGERPSPQRYALRYETDQWQWNDTYYLKYHGLLGDAAYRKAVNDHHFALIYLDNTTGHGSAVRTQLLSQPRSTAYYVLQTQVPRYLRGERVGRWEVWVPREAAG